VKKFLFYLLPAITILLLSIFLQKNKIEPFQSFSLRFNDINFELQDKEINKQIVFLAIDEKSVNKYGRWPWKREILAEGISKLERADLLLMDMIFSEETNTNADQLLADSIANLDASVCGFFLRKKSTQRLPNGSLELLEDSSLDLLQSEVTEYKSPTFIASPYAEINIPSILESCTLSGSFSTLPESDGLMRAYPIAVYYENYLYPSLAIQGLRIKFDSDINRVSKKSLSLANKEIFLNEKGFVRLNFYKREQYNIISFLDLMEGKISPAYFEGKIVILGITEVGSGDVVSTPLGMMYGPLLHYTFLSNYLQDQLIQEYPNITTMLIIFLALLPLLLVSFIKGVKTRAAIYAMSYLSLYIYIRYLFVENSFYIDLFYPLLALILSGVVIEGIAFTNQEKSGRFIKDAFSAYLSADLLEQLINNPKTLTLGGENKELSILFSDIRGFTNISESMDAKSLVTLLNRYFTPMTQSVMSHQGMLDKYIGDAVMAFFNAPVDVPDHADKACLSALDMIAKLEVLNSELKLENIAPINIGIGINSAEVVVGNMGSDSRFNYTIMGDGVNLSSRIEGLTKNYGVAILITEFTVAKLTQEFIYRKIEPVAVKGKNEAVLVYELMPNSKQSKEIKASYDEALALYIDKKPKDAKLIFERLVTLYDDSVSKYFLEHLHKHQPWGVCKMHTK